MSNLQLIERAKKYVERTAIIAREGVFTYKQLLEASSSIASSLLNGAHDLKETSVAFLMQPGFQYVATQWRIWRAGGIAVPLSILHPIPELEYFISNSGSSIIVGNPNYEKDARHVAEMCGLHFVLTTDALKDTQKRAPLGRDGQAGNDCLHKWYYQ